MLPSKPVGQGGVVVRVALVEVTPRFPTAGSARKSFGLFPRLLVSSMYSGNRAGQMREGQAVGTQHMHAHASRHATRALAAARLACSRSSYAPSLRQSTLEQPM